MRVLACITPGPSWLPGRTVWEQPPVVLAHLGHMRDGYDAGIVLVGGPLRSGMAGMALLEVVDLDAARAFATADPAVAAHVLRYDVAEVLPSFDALSGLRSAAGTGDVLVQASL